MVRAYAGVRERSRMLIIRIRNPTN